MQRSSFQQRLWHRVCSIPGLALVAIGGSLISFKYARWSLSAFHYTVEGNHKLYLALVVGVVLIPWITFALWAVIASVLEGLKRFAIAPELPEYLEGLSDWHKTEAARENQAVSLEQPSATEESSHTKSVLHRLMIPWILVIHTLSWGAAFLSISVVHITLPLKFWVVLAACAVLLPVGITVIAVNVYALILQEPEARAQGETATEFLIRKIQEKEQSGV